MDNKYIWLFLAALSGGFVAQVRSNTPLSPFRRISHLIAGCVIAVYASPVIINRYDLVGTDWQYVVPFGVGVFWLKLFEAADQSISNIRFPWSK